MTPKTNSALNNNFINQQNQDIFNDSRQKTPNTTSNLYNNNNISNTFNDFDDNNLTQFTQKSTVSKNKNNLITSSLTPIDNLEILKLQNQALKKSNLDLKNYNKCLKMELNSYKKMALGNLSNYSGYSNMPMSQYDDNINNYIETLKTSLNTSQMSNIELQDLMKTVQNQKKELEQQYNDLNRKIEECNLILTNNLQGGPKIEINNDYIEKCKNLENENESIKNEIDELTQEIENQKIANENLEQVIESMNKESYDNEELLKNLKNTIEKLKLQNKQGKNVNTQADIQITKNSNMLRAKQEEINNLNEKINQVNSELNLLKNENKNLMEQMKKKQQENSKDDLLNQRLMVEINNLKTNNQVLDECLKDRKKTILELKQSLKIMNGIKETGDNNLGNVEQIKENPNIEAKKKRLADLIADTKEKSNQLEKIKDSYMQIIDTKDARIQELKDKLGIVD